MGMRRCIDVSWCVFIITDMYSHLPLSRTCLCCPLITFTRGLTVQVFEHRRWQRPKQPAMRMLLWQVLLSGKCIGTIRHSENKIRKLKLKSSIFPRLLLTCVHSLSTCSVCLFNEYTCATNCLEGQLSCSLYTTGIYCPHVRVK